MTKAPHLPPRPIRFAGIALILLPSLLIPVPSSAALSLQDLGTDICSTPPCSPPSAWTLACQYLPYCSGTGPTTTWSGMRLLGAIIGNAVLWVIGSVAVCAVIYGAIRIITSTGDQEKITAGKKAIQYGLIGVLLAVIANEVVYWACYLLYDMGGTTPSCIP